MRFAIRHNFAALLRPLLRHLFLAITLVALYGPASATVIHVSVDTSGFGVSSGYVDMQFGASSGGALATATVTNMTGFDSNAYTESWGLTPVAGGFQFRNDTANDYFQAVTFGGLLSFDLAFAGGYDAAAGYVSAFTFSALSNDFAALGAADPLTGALATFLWTPSLTEGGEGSLNISAAGNAVAVVPEPGVLALLAIGFAALAGLRGRRPSRGMMA
jgi:hypothetical protein